MAVEDITSQHMFTLTFVLITHSGFWFSYLGSCCLLIAWPLPASWLWNFWVTSLYFSQIELAYTGLLLAWICVTSIPGTFGPKEPKQASTGRNPFCLTAYEPNYQSHQSLTQGSYTTRVNMEGFFLLGNSEWGTKQIFYSSVTHNYY